MTALMRRRLRERRAETHLQQLDDRRRYFDAAKIQSVGALDLRQKTALHVKKGRKDAGDRLAVDGDEPLGRADRIADGRLGFAQNVAFPRGVLEWSRTGQAALA